MQSDQVFCFNVILIKPGPAISTSATFGSFEIYGLSLLAISLGFNFKLLLKSIAKLVDISPLTLFFGGSNVIFLSNSVFSKL